jgi:catechol 2,3-dioxygenase
MPSLPATLRLGAVHLTVSDLDRSIAWYQRVLGLRVHDRDVATGALGVGEEDLLVLHEDATARPAGRHAGIYHYALLFASREELGRAALRIAAARAPIDGASDHETHEAIYLSDPDGIGIELAADRPREAWPPSLGYASGPKPLDVDDLLGTVAGEEPPPQAGGGMRIGHLHLYAGDVERGLAFYRDVLGFELMALLPSAAFVAAGGYHHHLGFNTWRYRGADPVPEGVVGLDHWTVVLDTPEQVEEVRERVAAAGVAHENGDALLVRDPWGMAVRFTAA